MRPEDTSDEQWQQPNSAPSQAPFQAPEEPIESTPEVPQAPQDPIASDGTPKETVEPTTAPESEDDTALLRWDAPEYAHHERGAGWYVIFGVITLVAILVAILVIHSISFAILVPVMAVALYIYTRRAPEVLHYTLSRKGLHINDRLFAYSQFKSFGVITHAGVHSAVLVPRKRFQISQTVYFQEEIGEQLVDMLASRLPMKELEPDALDRLLARLHL